MSPSVKRGSLTCDLWRHQAADALFEFEVLFTTHDAARGIVECTVHAGNLTRPERAKVVVIRRIEPITMHEVALAMVEASK